MKREVGLPDVVLLIITLVGLVAIYALDSWLHNLQLLGRSTFNAAPYIWAGSIANLVVAGLILLLAWYTLREKRRNLFIAVSFTLVGLTLAFYPVVIFLTGIDFFWLPAVIFRGPASLFLTASAFIAGIGIITFLLPEHQQN